MHHRQIPCTLATVVGQNPHHKSVCQASTVLLLKQAQAQHLDELAANGGASCIIEELPADSPALAGLPHSAAVPQVTDAADPEAVEAAATAAGGSAAASVAADGIHVQLQQGSGFEPQHNSDQPVAYEFAAAEEQQPLQAQQPGERGQLPQGEYAEPQA